MLPAVRYSELLNADELAFVERREERERKQFYRVVKVAMLLCFIFPFFLAWYKAGNGEENAFSYMRYFAGVFFLMCFSSGILYLVYRYSLQKLQYDVKHTTKTIELTRITRKQYMPQNNTFYFYLDSPHKLSIEVSELYFRKLDQGDEVNIEYSTYARLYLGYY